MWADIRPDVVKSISSGQAKQAQNVARRLHVPEGRSTPTVMRSRSSSLSRRPGPAESAMSAAIQLSRADKILAPPPSSDREHTVSSEVTPPSATEADIAAHDSALSSHAIESPLSVSQDVSDVPERFSSAEASEPAEKAKEPPVDESPSSTDDSPPGSPPGPHRQ